MYVGRAPIRASLLRPARDGAVLACILFAAAHLIGLLPTGVDAHTYWVANPTDPYGTSTPGAADAFFYSPVFAQLILPIHALPWNVFIAAWTLLLGAALAWQAGYWLAPVLLLVPVFAELSVGNIHLLLAAALVAGFRWPWTWSFLLLTKITPGVGVLWFLFRREWRSLAIALGATAALVAVSFAVAPRLWSEWLQLLVSAAAAPAWVFTVPIPLPVRLVAAVALIFWGARADHRWTVAVASCIALPVLWINGLAMLVATIPLLSRELGPSLAARWLAGATPAARPVEVGTVLA